MNISILKTASRRELKMRYWDNLYFGWQKGKLSVGSGYFHPHRHGDIWFQWDVHEHHGGRGGLHLPMHRGEVRNLVRRLIDNPGNQEAYSPNV